MPLHVFRPWVNFYQAAVEDLVYDPSRYFWVHGWRVQTPHELCLGWRLPVDGDILIGIICTYLLPRSPEELIL